MEESREENEKEKSDQAGERQIKTREQESDRKE
jgi:hypothetical protein